ncbi:MAG: hypothetical protein ABS45_06645 [Comamonas sp. SCN 65-56]|uniref:twin transmembrane helix small protein n=1 Tax=Comamonas sp. SCN 65-56 TaxID=1660095 RepID=UPI000869383A|nr:twin transmembrane helix small protein [Comamonas sp. SCN 65-56]ODS92503.1 MAG: hypothetical protein ABS45_06645 [Comamonas sp. SCN 65-56]
MKIAITLAFLAILGSLGTALYFMMRGDGTNADSSKRMAGALAVRVGISVALFICLLIAWKLGYIQPTGLAVSEL